MVESFELREETERSDNNQDYQHSEYVPIPSNPITETITNRERKEADIALVNFVIDEEKKDWLKDEQICFKLLWEWYWKEILDSKLNEDVINTLNNTINGLFNKYWYKIGSEDSFKDLFFSNVKDIIYSNSNISKEELFQKVEQELKKIELNSPISMDFINDYLGEKRLGFTVPREEVLHWDWSNSIDVLNNLSFYPHSFGDDCIFPDWWDPRVILEKWKSIGLWIDEVHWKYNWEWVNVAIIDNPLTNFHWAAVKSIFVGQETWIAPQANLKYVEETNNEDIYDNLLILRDKNIRVISMSFNLYQPWMAKNPEKKNKIEWLVKELNEKWTWVLSGDEFIKNFGILGRKNPMWNIDDFQNYQVTWPDQRSINRRRELLDSKYEPQNEWDKYERVFTHDFYWAEIDIENLIFINSGDRTVEDPNWWYRHDVIWGTSWTIPAVAWYYTLACQRDPTMTPDKFMKLARDTAQIVSISNIPADMNHIPEWRVPMNAKIKVLDIKALIQRIEEEKK